MREVARVSGFFFLMWFFSNYFYNYGLLYASITSSVVLSNTSPTWVFLLGISCLVPRRIRQHFNPLKLALVIISLSGFGLIATADIRSSHKASADAGGDSESQSESLIGDCITVLSAMFYAVYATYLKLAVPEEKEQSFHFSWFLGFVGLFNDFAILPLFFIFDATGLEIFEWPNKETVALLSLNALVGTVVSDYCWARSVVLLGPLITSLGITLTFPISALVDVFLNGKSFGWLYLAGSLCIFLGFFGIAAIEYREDKKKKALKDAEHLWASNGADLIPTEKSD